MKVYLAGPMSGYPDFNRQEFTRAEGRWQAAGWEVLNPHNLDLTEYERESKHPHEWYMRRDLHFLLLCDAICLLPGAEYSKGAQMEKQVAEWTGIPAYSAPPATHPFEQNVCCTRPSHAHFPKGADL